MRISSIGAVVFWIGSALAQSPVGNVAGEVKDPSGASIAGGTVTVTSAATGNTRSATTDDQGYFLISTLQPGTYHLKIESTGFQPYAADVPVEVGQTARLNVSLAVVGETTKVEVSSNVVDIDTERITVGGVVNTKQIDELPLNGRNYLELAKLEPGVEISDGKAVDPTRRGTPAFPSVGAWAAKPGSHSMEWTSSTSTSALRL